MAKQERIQTSEQAITPVTDNGFTSTTGIVRGDPVHRYRTAIDFCIEAGAANDVLDIGGSRDNPAMREVLPAGSNFVSVNVRGEAHGRIPHIIADGRSLPMLEDNSFPCVVAADVVEHVPHDNVGDTFDERLKLAKELVRVSDNVTVLTAPFQDKEKQNQREEQEFLEEMQRLGLDPKRSIFEHRERGLPSLRQLVKIGRALRQPFDIRPATNRSTLFQSLYDQAIILAAGNEQNIAMQTAAETNYKRTTVR